MTEEKWVKIGNFSQFDIMALGTKRRLVDPETETVYREYNVEGDYGDFVPPELASEDGDLDFA